MTPSYQNYRGSYHGCGAFFSVVPAGEGPKVSLEANDIKASILGQAKALFSQMLNSPVATKSRHEKSRQMSYLPLLFSSRTELLNLFLID